jgi:hypothetical protein
METRPGDSPAPTSKRFPLSVVVFREITSVPGINTRVSTFETGATRWDQGKTWVAPQAWYDPDLRVVIISGRHYPIEGVQYFERAKMALTRPAEPRPPSEFDYVIGKKALRSVAIETRESHPQKDSK